MVTLSPSDVTALRSIKNSCILLLVLFRIGAPITAKRLAELIDMDYQTCRKQLHSLAYLGLVSETLVGWQVLPGGRQLVLPIGETVDNSVTSVDNAIISRSTALLKDPSSTSAHTFLLEEEEEEEEEEQRENIAPLDERCQNALDELEYSGVMVNQPVIDLVKRSDWITEEYIAHQVERLNKQRKFSSGLLLRVCKDHDPVAGEDEIRCRKYSRDLDKYGIQH